MATTIKLKNGSGAPLAGDLVQGEPALDLTNKRLYTEDSGGTVIEVGTNPSTLNVTGDLTVDTNTLFVDASANAVGIGLTNNLYAPLNVASDDTGNTGQLNLTGETNNLKRLRVGYNTTDNVGYLQAVTVGTGFDDLALQPSGGNVGIGTPSPESKLDIRGDIQLAAQSAIGLDFYSTVSAIPAAQNHGYVATANSLAGGVNGDLLIAPRTSAGASVRFITGTTPTERMRIAASGNVGIGTAAPVSRLSVEGAAATGTIMTLGGDGLTSRGLVISNFTQNSTGVGFDFNAQGLTGSNGTLTFSTNSSERMRIDASGNVGIGVTNPSQLLSVGSATAAATVGMSWNTANVERGSIKYNGSTGEMAFTSGFSPYGGFMTFTANGSERMRIDSSGGLTVGNSTQIAFNENTDTGTTIIGNGALTTFRDSASANLYVGKIGALDGDVLEFRRNGLDVGSISVTSGATSYNTSSDVRLKENIQDADSSGSVIDAIKVRQYDWKADGTHQRYGFVAQELDLVYPEAVSKGETEDDTWGVDYSKLVPLLVKSVQELSAELNSVKAELAALKGA